MHTYGMLAHGDRVLVAVSGGADSLALAWVLSHWRRKAPIDYDLQAVHVDMEPCGGRPGAAAREIIGIMERAAIPVRVLPASWQPPPEAAGESRDVCFRCSRSRRNQLFRFARDHGFNRLALGHHRDDIIETFFLNLTCAGNISTMRPCQKLFSGRLAVIRPFSYLDKTEVEAICRRLGLVPVRTRCPLSGQTRRSEVHEMLREIYARIPGAKQHIFAALGNVRTEYLLGPVEHHADNP
ncbi:MAG TPA: PP-loop domain-containing protein [Desulfobulbus sp.]|nr:PP-loop domain-containing protein [Desulfobulbus sp.]